MKFLTSILLIGMSFLACKGQEARTLVYFLQNDVDSLNIVISERDELIDVQAIHISELESRLLQCDSVNMSSNQEFIEDTINVQVQYNYLTATLDKQGDDIRFTLVNNETKRRIQTWYIGYTSEAWFMNDTMSVGHLYGNEDYSIIKAYVGYENH